ncbi:MAG: SAM-dependent methyltransferase [Phycisphaerae bacterium]|nr:SAM-dependent methyltransferase [Phycisphaerae bacterium]
MVRVRVPASFRDRSGFVFTDENGQVFRQVNRSYEADYRWLGESGLYRNLTQAGLLIHHEEVPQTHGLDPNAFTIIRPRLIPFISYPYEWSFSQLKEAALLTLEVQRRALAHGMTLKDCSAYNVQFEGTKSVLIDTLSFEVYVEGTPWTRYRQFCRHFLAPLTLMSSLDVRLSQLLRVHLDGVPLDLAASMLPLWTRLRPGPLRHLALQARSHGTHQDPPAGSQSNRRAVGRLGIQALIDSLERAVSKLAWRPPSTAWSEYYSNSTYTPEALEHKKRLVSDYLDRIRPRTAWDLGANTGLFSRIAGRRGAATMSFDVDPACVEMNFLSCRAEHEPNVLPLCLDVTNPSPGIGWSHEERSSLAARGPADVAIALALVHHLALGEGVPLDRIARFLRQVCDHLIVEFVAKDDPMALHLLAPGKDTFPDYHEKGFERVFSESFEIHERAYVRGSSRALYRMEARP